MKLSVFAGIPFFLILCFSHHAQGQSMYDIFLSLPSYCTPGLSIADRKTLVKDTEFTVEARKEEDEIDYTIDTVTPTYMSYEYSNSKGQGINENYELKKFKLANGKAFILFSKAGDPRIHSDKYTIKTFDISGNTIIEDPQGLIPENINYSVFLKFGTPDSVKAKLEKTSYYTFNLLPNPDDKVTFQIVLESDKDKKWLTGDTMIFQWNGKMFTSSIIFRKEDE